MAKKQIEVDLILNSEDSQKKLKELQLALKQLPTGTAEWKKVYGEIDDLKDRLKGAKQGTDDWIDSLESAGGPIGMLGRGLNGAKVAFSSFNTILKTSVIGLIVTAVGGLVAAFTQSETAMKKLQPLFVGLEKIMGGIFRAFEPVLDLFIELATYALPTVTKVIGVFYSILFATFSLIKNVGVGALQILKGIATLDFDTAKKGLESVKNGILGTVDAGMDAYKRFEEGTKEQTKTEKEEQAKRDEAAKKAAEEREKRRKEELDKQKKNLDAQIQLEINKDNTSKENLKKLLDERMKLEMQGQKMTDAEKELLRQEYAKKLEDALIEDDKKRKEEEKKRLDALAKELDAKIQLEVNSQNTSREQLKALLDERMNIELANVELTESEKEVIRQTYAKRLEDALKDDRDKQKKARLESLQNQLAESMGNSEKQIEVYQKLQQELTTSTDYSEAERAQLRKQYQDAILQTLDSANKAEIASLENKYGEFARFDSEYYTQARAAQDDYQAKLKQSFEAGAITQAQFNERAAQNSKARRELDRLEVQSNQEKTAAIGNALGQLSDLVGKDTIAGKAFAIAKATIDTYQSAVAAYKSLSGIPVVGPVLGGIAAAAAVAQGIATVKKIVAVQVPGGMGGTQVPAGTIGSTPGAPAPAPTTAAPIQISAQRRAQGGLVRGPGTSTSDSIPALLSDGEFVVNARSTQLFRPLLSAINDAAGLPGFAVGGLVNGRMKREPDNTDKIARVLETTLTNQPIRTYVTASDISSQQQFDRVIKSRSLI